MKRSIATNLIAISLLGIASNAEAGHSPRSAVTRCAPDAVVAGTVCLDAYEASVWRVPESTTTNAPLVRKIQRGEVTQADLDAAGATQLGTNGGNYAPCTDIGLDCAGYLFAVSLPSVLPSSQISWFQAQEACANSGKRLPTNAEWQIGANGTPDAGADNGTTDCNSASGVAALTGSRSNCVSARGAFDMAGNLLEWVADWVPASTECPTWSSFSDDKMCLAGASTSQTGPGALLRGGWFSGAEASGPLTVLGNVVAYRALGIIGFRCAR